MSNNATSSISTQTEHRQTQKLLQIVFNALTALSSMVIAFLAMELSANRRQLADNAATLLVQQEKIQTLQTNQARIMTNFDRVPIDLTGRMTEIAAVLRQVEIKVGTLDAKIARVEAKLEPK